MSSLNNYRRQKLLMILAMSSGMIILTSNMAASKIWSLFGMIPVDGGIVMFPFSYIVTDLLIEFYGKKRANDVAFFATVANGIAMLLLFLVSTFPAFTGYDSGSYDTIFGYFGRITLASLVSYFLSTLTNNNVFDNIKQRQLRRTPNLVQEKVRDLAFGEAEYRWVEGKINKYDSFDYLVRALKSSFVARFVDSLIFETIAFFGVLPFSDFLKQAIFAYIAGTIIESLLAFPAILVQHGIAKYLGDDD